ncbi:hypothetical protein BDV09DRAFT_189163 [Aspergillus tetrazonus]|uniref:DUF6699 domain-containing protein n=1 Tax=Emericella nidulans (strain FGSC A4 / ATCC 38163 / CBS 112.46 / NRRL 194 / M139) TaxID=227321 RepID=Q5BDK2_EMENI|nr:hypothetical protein [Aspergillus nidulans FGSC A4]EAA65208.1 hypothetical protein AN1378.2 [Aspergillus nidulans FGSC A4]CBF87613.1 TPA: hypothetical protein ANIA_01378 [Aspergillus nidulans FGSC A4]|eukprot:XP_658982.1 hypothetical protein AN1378.2 [Aspergillus nidulans FGSC A4]
MSLVDDHTDHTEHNELKKVDSAIGGLSISPKDEKASDKAEKADKKAHRRTSSQAEGVYNIKELEEKRIEITLPIETQKTGWKLNTSPSTIEDKDILKLHLVNPPVKKIDLHFPLGLEVTARNLKGVTIKDALDAIYKQFKKKADDELDKPYLAGFEWDKEECWTRLIVHQTKQGPPAQSSGKKSKKKAKEEA